MYKTLLIFLFACAMAGSVSGEIRNENLHQDTSESFFVSKTALFGYGMIAGIVVAVGIVLFSIERWPKKPMERGKSTEAAEKSNWDLQELEGKLKDYDRRYGELERDNATLKKELAEAKQQLITGMPQAERTTVLDTTVNANQFKPMAEQANTTLYYLQPGTDGRFKEQSKVNSAVDALYALTYQSNNPSEATLKFIDTRENTFLAVQNESTWILVACERSNVPTEHTTSIRTDVPGKAILRNKEWEILQKAKITYL